MKIIKNILKIDRRSLLVMIIKCGIRHPQEIPFPFPEFFFRRKRLPETPFPAENFPPEVCRRKFFGQKFSVRKPIFN